MVKDKGMKIIHKLLETAYPPAQPPISGINKLLKLFLLSTFNSKAILIHFIKNKLSVPFSAKIELVMFSCCERSIN